MSGAFTGIIDEFFCKLIAAFNAKAEAAKFRFHLFDFEIESRVFLKVLRQCKAEFTKELEPSIFALKPPVH